MELQAERDGSGPPIVLVHGFTQTGRCWGPEAADLATDHEVVRIDAPGHGRSHGVAADLVAGAAMIADVGGTATYLGYSMGARFCLHVALRHPERVRGLVLVGGTAGIDDDAERAERHVQDLRTAQRIADDGLPAFLDAWIAQPLFAGLRPERQFRAERLTNTVDGLMTSLERAGTGAQTPSWDALPDLAMPVLVVAGALDTKFAALAARLATTIGENAQVALVPDAGHAAHLEQPDAFVSLLRPWLARHRL